MRTVSGARMIVSARAIREFAVCVAATVCLSAGGQSVHAGEQIILPYECSVRNGRVVADPSSDQAYRIYGSRERQPHRACSPSNPDRCRTFMLHRFSMACGSGRVSWPAFYAAISDETDGRAFLDGGRLHMRMGSQWRGHDGRPRVFPWRHRDGYGNGDRDRRGFDDPEFGSRGRDDVVELPPGFAPVAGTRAIFTELDPRIAEAERGDERPDPIQRPGDTRWDGDDPLGDEGLAQSAPQTSDVPPGWAASTRPAGPPQDVPPPQRKLQVLADEKTDDTKAEATKSDTKVTDTKVSGTNVPDSKAGAIPLDSVTKVITPAAEPEAKVAAVDAGPGVKPDDKMVETAAASKDTAAPSPAVPGTSFAPTILNNPSAPRPDEQKPDATPSTTTAGDATPSPAAVAAATPAVITPPVVEPAPKIDSAKPLAIDIETGAVPAGKATPAVPALSWQSLIAGAAGLLLLGSLWILRRQSAQPVVSAARRTSRTDPRLPGLLPETALDLQGGVDASKQLVVSPQLNATPPAEPTPAAAFDPGVFVVPKTRAEALAVLGLSGAANQAMIGKVVDALRQSWHPDTAASDDERRVREARLKQINVASDILSV